MHNFLRERWTHLRTIERRVTFHITSNSFSLPCTRHRWAHSALMPTSFEGIVYRTEMVSLTLRWVLMQGDRCVNWWYDGTPWCSGQTGAKLSGGPLTFTADYALLLARMMTLNAKYPHCLIHAGICCRTGCFVLSTSRSLRLYSFLLRMRFTHGLTTGKQKRREPKFIWTFPRAEITSLPIFRSKSHIQSSRVPTSWLFRRWSLQPRARSIAGGWNILPDYLRDRFIDAEKLSNNICALLISTLWPRHIRNYFMPLHYIGA